MNKETSFWSAIILILAFWAISDQYKPEIKEYFSASNMPEESTSNSKDVNKESTSEKKQSVLEYQVNRQTKLAIERERELRSENLSLKEQVTSLEKELEDEKNKKVVIKEKVITKTVKHIVEQKQMGSIENDLFNRYASFIVNLPTYEKIIKKVLTYGEKKDPNCYVFYGDPLDQETSTIYIRFESDNIEFYIMPNKTNVNWPTFNINKTIIKENLCASCNENTFSIEKAEDRIKDYTQYLKL